MSYALKKAIEESSKEELEKLVATDDKHPSVPADEWDWLDSYIVFAGAIVMEETGATFFDKQAFYHLNVKPLAEKLGREVSKNEFDRRIKKMYKYRILRNRKEIPLEEIFLSERSQAVTIASLLADDKNFVRDISSYKEGTDRIVYLMSHLHKKLHMKISKGALDKIIYGLVTRGVDLGVHEFQFLTDEEAIKNYSEIFVPDKNLDRSLQRKRLPQYG